MTKTTANPTTQQRTVFRTDVQGLRAIAVGAVVLYHAGVPFLTGGYVGVDVFFVISGFLITSHLLSQLRKTGRVSFASFYAKRARRILPASFVVLALSVVAALIWFPPLLLREVWMGAVATALYVPNYLFAAQGTNYLAETTPSLFQHYWSLGIEEQFYIVWPLLLALGFVVFKRPKRLFALVLALVVLSFVAGLLLTTLNQPWAFFSLPTRAWELGVGGLVAFALTYRRSVIVPKAAPVLGWVGIAAILAPVFLYTSATPFPSYWAAIPVLGTAAVIIAGAGSPKGTPTAMLSLRPMLFVGAISYSLYLVHWPLLVVPQTAVGYENPLPLSVTLTLGLVGVPLAWLMYRYVENPAREAKWLVNARPRRSLMAAAAASVSAVVLVAGAFAYPNAQPLHTAEVAADTVISAPPIATNFVPSNLAPSLRAVSGDQPEIYEDGCHLDFDAAEPADCLYGNPADPTIVLFGDSHAAQWFPALSTWALANGYSVQSHTKSSCPSVRAEVARNAVPYTACSQWRVAVLSDIDSTDPALVILANYGDAPITNQENGYADAWETALSTTLASIEAPTAVMADPPNMQATPSICLSNHLSNTSDCDVDRNEALSGDARAAETQAAAKAGVPLVDLTDYMCGPAKCSPILGNTLVYRDAHHLTATFSEELAVPLGAGLSRALAQ